MRRSAYVIVCCSQVYRTVADAASLQQREVWTADTEARQGASGSRAQLSHLSDSLRPLQGFCRQVFRCFRPGDLYTFFVT